MAEMFHVGTCPICQEGTLGLRSCGQCEAIAIVCDECDVAWSTPDLSAKPTVSRGADLPCPTCSAPLYAAGSRWATNEEIARRAWLQTAIDAGELKLSKGEAYAPEAN
ncbi:hypothetical protein [Adhaeretor mobilis]|uniref:Uncharacterized protein n=1 Tax=Adhaeretor mobilis TaxID=1930276 RepID=A0A517MPF3_9BACT|nr:hypothetical protein [Adhaeretor mobilis]QDS96763.1 hypothetical protein HG15A2_00210 [Adhaeretor mobilis]